MNRKMAAAVALTVWLTIVIGIMAIVQQFDLDIFFVLALIGLLVIAELIRLRYIQPAYQRFIGYLVLAGIVVFASIAVTKVMEIIAA